MTTSSDPTVPFARRQFLKGVTLGASGLVLNPLLQRLAHAAEGRTAAPRFLFVVEGNGLPPLQVHPVGLPFLERAQREKTAVHALRDFELPPALQPVAAFRDRMAIVQGLSGRMCGGGHSSDHGALGAYHANNGRHVQGATVDAVLGQAFPGIFPSLTLGIASNPEESVIFNCSADAPGRSLPTLCQPHLAYERLFGSVAEGGARAGFAAKRNLLDHLRGDVARVRQRLGGVDREKLDAYLSAYETLGGQSQRLVESRNRLASAVPVAADKYLSKVETDRLDAHFELAAAAMIGGLSNVVTIASGVGFPFFNITFTGLGIEQGKHPIGHSLYAADDKLGWERSEKIRRFHFQLIARFMATLRKIPEGDGTMLDHTVVVYLSDAAETHHSRCFEWPMVILGNAGRRLRTDGRYVVLPDYGRPGHRTINTLYNTLLHAAGAPRDDFGKPDPNLDPTMCRGTLGELLT